MENLVTTIRNSLNNEPLDINNESSSLMTSKDSRDFRKVQMPETKIGLGSTEGDLIFMVKQYLEIVGLVFFVWLLGE
jgi:hypothetical protein